ncbi:hypothetical protein NP564_25825, partial [Vibrio parahaemolyticus]|nr:hypothetical protein [Vibrio parahaemolyticus]
IAVVEALAEMLAEAPTEASVTPCLKWPNDVLLRTDGGDGKVAGIIAESSFNGDRLSHAVLGIGINVNQSVDEFPV